MTGILSICLNNYAYTVLLIITSVSYFILLDIISILLKIFQIDIEQSSKHLSMMLWLEVLHMNSLQFLLFQIIFNSCQHNLF